MDHEMVEVNAITDPAGEDEKPGHQDGQRLRVARGDVSGSAGAVRTSRLSLRMIRGLVPSLGRLGLASRTENLELETIRGVGKAPAGGAACGRSARPRARTAARA